MLESEFIHKKRESVKYDVSEILSVKNTISFRIQGLFWLLLYIRPVLGKSEAGLKKEEDGIINPMCPFRRA